MKLSERKIDPAKREDGAWVKDIPEWDELRLKVRGIGNKDWAKRSQALVQAVPRARRVNGLLRDDADRINGILLLDHALIDWRGLEDDEGKPEPYSKDLAKKYLTQPEYEPFRDAVMWAASVVAERGTAEIEADAKN